MTQRHETVSFVVRIWLEPGPSESSLWRGHIQHVQSGQGAYFQELGHMVKFLEGVSGVRFPTRASHHLRNSREG